MDVVVPEEWRENFRMSKDNTRHMICSLVRMSRAQKYVQIGHRVKGKAKRTNICPVPCKRKLSVQKLVRIKTCPAPCKRGLTRPNKYHAGLERCK